MPRRDVRPTIAEREGWTDLPMDEPNERFAGLYPPTRRTAEKFMEDLASGKLANQPIQWINYSTVYTSDAVVEDEA